ncbi:MFS transporter [Paenibacillus sp. GCM10023252]|uniref:MFS transporter n=1 Tax=Paenibacillus sp. GCM10023252 TaxID=3252649 RepID=UPI00360E32CE
MTQAATRSFGAEIRLISVILFVVDFVRGAILVSFLPIFGEKTLGLPLHIIGIAITAHYFTDTVVRIAIGYLMDRFGVRRIVQAGLVICLAGVLMFQFATLPWVFITASALYGIGVSPIWIMCLTKVTEEKRATQMGYLYTIWMVGLGAGPIVCNILLDYSTSFTYYLLLGMSLIACILSIWIVESRSSAVAVIPIKEQLVVLRERLGKMKLLLPGMILQTTGASMLVPILPSLATNQFGFSGAQYSILLTTGGLFAVAGLMPMGRLSDKLGGKKWFLVLGFSSFSIALYALALGLKFWECLLIASALGLSYSAILPAWNALLAAYVPPKQEGLGWGILSTVEGIGVMIGPLAGGFLASWHTESLVVWVSAVLFGVIGLFYLWFPFPEDRSGGRTPR